MKNKILWFFLFFLVAVCVFPKESPWGSLKKIHFYDSVKKYDKVLENLARIKPRDIDGTQLKDVAKDLITFGDHYFSLKEYRNAEAFYLKVIDLSPDYWYLYNRLEKIDREQGSLFIGFSNAFKQLLAMLKSFSASFIIFNTFFNLLFFACLLVFFLFGLLLFIKYFKLAANDLLLSEQGVISMKKLILVILTLLWPVLMLSGWMIYPFIIIGFLWTYINENEKKTVFFMLIFVFLFTLLYSLNLTLEQGVKDKKFKTIQKLCSGHLFAGDVYEKFDNRLKVLQAYNYYENKQYDTALEILISTGETYEDRLKFDLMGNIYFKSDDYVESTKYYNESLRIDEHRDVTLNNFTLSLLKNSNEDVFNSYAKRYPQLRDKRKEVSALREERVFFTPLLWKRLFSSSEEHFGIGDFLSNVVLEFFKLPILYYALFFAAYFFGIKKIYPLLGDSTYCSKCTKIIKEASVHKTHIMCEECYQLFLIKDVIFLEAKILKEKELNKKFKKKYILGLIFSTLVPGLNFNFKDNNRLFILLNMLFYLLLGFSVVSGLVFSGVFGAAPLIFSLVGMLAFVCYFIVNLFSIMGDYNGF